MSPPEERILIVGRSASVLLEAVRLLRERGYRANASNQFDRLLDDYDVADVDIVLFGGAVPSATKDDLRARATALNPQVRYVQGLAGIAPVIAAQLEQLLGEHDDEVSYDQASHLVRFTVLERGRATVEAFWATFVPPEPVPHSRSVLDDELTAGVHEIGIPVDVPREGSFVVIRVGHRVCVLAIGGTPASVQRIAASGTLPPPQPVTTHLPWTQD